MKITAPSVVVAIKSLSSIGAAVQEKLRINQVDTAQLGILRNVLTKFKLNTFSSYGANKTKYLKLSGDFSFRCQVVHLSKIFSITAAFAS